MLAQLGVDEATVRERSVDWLRDGLQAVVQHQAATAALGTRLNFMAVQAAQHGDEAYDQMIETLEQFDRYVDADSETPAVTDEDALHGLAQQKPASFERVRVA